MPVLCKLADPQRYRAFDWDITRDPRDLEYWLDLFENFPAKIERHLREDGLTGPDFERRWRAFRTEYQAAIDVWRNDPAARGGVNTLALCLLRQTMLKKYGWPDPYIKVKARENELAAKMYPATVARVDAAAPADRWLMLLRGLLAGNIFDLGAPQTAAMYDHGQVDYQAMLERLPHRPWFIDDADEVIARLQRRSWKQCLFFVDNAGADIVLGVIPLAREMARSGINVILSANSEPALNDITHAELVPLLRRLAASDAVLSELLRAGQIQAVPSGGDVPLIDLSRVSEECNAVAANSDLMVLEGMGRGVESNWRQPFLCDVWRIALIKDESVARWLGCNLFDVVCRFDALK